MSDDQAPERRRPPMPRAAGDGDSGGSWFDRLVPEVLGRVALTVEVRAPETIRLGEPTSFYVVVRNRIPVPVTVSTPTSRLWGWVVDGAEEGDRRSFSPPETGRSVRFGGLERKVFEGTWDGRIREEGDGGWSDAGGTHTLTGYLAVEDWERRGLGAETEVTVEAGAPPAHQE